MAYCCIQALLAVEVIREGWATLDFRGTAGPDLPDEQGESPVEPRKDQGHTNTSPVQPTMRGYDPKIHVQAAKPSQEIDDMAAIST